MPVRVLTPDCHPENIAFCNSLKDAFSTLKKTQHNLSILPRAIDPNLTEGARLLLKHPPYKPISLDKVLPTEIRSHLKSEITQKCGLTINAALEALLQDIASIAASLCHMAGRESCSIMLESRPSANRKHTRLMHSDGSPVSLRATCAYIGPGMWCLTRKEASQAQQVLCSEAARRFNLWQIATQNIGLHYGEFAPFKQNTLGIRGDTLTHGTPLYDERLFVIITIR